MALSQGHQLGKTLVQHIWKVVGAFGFGIVAVVGGALIVSDVHRIPQGARWSPSSEKSQSGVQRASKDGSQPVQIPREDANTGNAGVQGSVDGNTAPYGDQIAGQNIPRRPSHRRYPGAIAEGIRPDAAARGQTSPAPPVGVAPGSGLGPIPQGAPPQAVTALLRPAPADPGLTVAPETPIPVRLSQQVSSKKNRTGEVFRGTLAGPLIVKGIVVAEAGAPVLGRIVEARSARIFRGGSNLNLELTDLGTVDGRLVKIKSTQWYDTGSHSRVVKAAILPSQAAKKAVSGVVSGMKEQNGVQNPPERTVTETADTGDKNERKGSVVTLPSGSEIVFRLLEPITVSGTAEHR